MSIHAALQNAEPDRNQFLDTIVRFADAMMARGRDAFCEGAMPSGDPRQSGFFASSLSRPSDGSPPGLLLDRIPPAPNGVREHDRVIDRDRAAAGSRDGRLYHEFTERFDLWPLAHQLAPEHADACAVALWNWHINDKDKGNFDRHAHYEALTGPADLAHAILRFHLAASRETPANQ